MATQPAHRLIKIPVPRAPDRGRKAEKGPLKAVLPKYIHGKPVNSTPELKSAAAMAAGIKKQINAAFLPLENEKAGIEKKA